MTELFETGKTYTFYFGREHSEHQVSGAIISYQAPLVKIETEGLTRIINCTSAYFVEAIARREDKQSDGHGGSE